MFCRVGIRPGREIEKWTSRHAKKTIIRTGVELLVSFQFQLGIFQTTVGLACFRLGFGLFNLDERAKVKIEIKRRRDDHLNRLEQLDVVQRNPSTQCRLQTIDCWAGLGFSGLDETLDRTIRTAVKFVFVDQRTTTHRASNENNVVRQTRTRTQKCSHVVVDRRALFSFSLVGRQDPAGTCRGRSLVEVRVCIQY